MRYGLLASASLIVFAFTMSGSALAADCGCRDAVRAALAKQKVVVAAPAKKPAAKKPAMKKEPAKAPAVMPMAQNVLPTPGDCGCRDSVRAALAADAPMPAQTQAPAPQPEMASAASADAFYDYASANAIDNYPYTHHWTVAPQGYVPPLSQAPRMSANAPVTFAAPAMTDDGAPPDLPPEGPAAFAPQGAFLAYAGGDGYAYGAGDSGNGGGAPAPAAPPASYEAGITIEQQGWIGGVGRAALFGGGGGGGGGGGLSIAMSQPDSLNGPSYNSFGDSYGGDYQSAQIVNQMRQEAFAPHPAATQPNTGTVSQPNTGTVSH